MSDWRPLSRSFNGTQTDVAFEDGKVIFRTQQEVDPVLDSNKELRNSGDEGWIFGGDMRRVASIPAAVVVAWMNEGFDLFAADLDQATLARKLNDPDNFYLRTAPGRLGPAGDGTYR